MGNGACRSRRRSVSLRIRRRVGTRFIQFRRGGPSRYLTIGVFDPDEDLEAEVVMETIRRWLITSSMISNFRS